MPSLPWSDRDPNVIRLCQICEEIPFSQLLSPRASHSKTVYSIKLSKILKNQSKCVFCKLLLDASCRKENDLFNSTHISGPLGNDNNFADRETFAKWVPERPGPILELLRREDFWPFGHTHDENEKDGVKTAAEELFRQAELSDVADVSFQSESNKGMSMKLDQSTALQATSLAVGIADVGSANRFVAGANTITAQFAIFNAKKPKKMPCWYILQLYTPSDSKASAISVRVYAHSKATRSPLKEISHFSFRMHRDVDLRQAGQQIWYGRPLPRKTDVEFFGTCLTKCYHSHNEVCGAKNAGPTPWTAFKGKFRLIDTFDMRIVEYDGVNPGSDDINNYAALSYVWGDPPLPPHWEEVATPAGHDPPSDPDFYYFNKHTRKWDFKNPMTKKVVSDLRLTTRNLPVLTQENGLKTRDSKIPLTVIHAIEVVKRLGLRYLWCDRLCIIQEPSDDREYNIAWMGQIYSEALLTIVAADSENATAGIQGVDTERDRDTQSTQFQPRTIARGIKLFLPAQMERNYGPWAKRAWTFQEQLLSRRLLVFSKGNAVWHCRVGIWREDVNAKDVDTASTELELLSMSKITSEFKHIESCPGLQSIHPDGSTRLFRTPEFADYIRTMENFSRRRITNPSDTLGAFGGVAKVFEKSMGRKFLHGLPLAYMDLALLWQPRRPMKRLVGTEKAPAPPSWSPLGWSCRGKDFAESGVYYETPYDIFADEAGIYARQKHPTEAMAGEERMRPRTRSLYHVSRNYDGTRKLTDIGMLASSGNQNVPPSTPGPESDLPPVLSDIKEHQLIIRTKVAKLSLTAAVTIKSTSTTVGVETYKRQVWDRDHPSGTRNEEGITITHGYLIGDPSNSSSEVGIATMTSNLRIQCPESVEAIILSQAQYLGNERRIDDLGYYLYNIMIIQRPARGEPAERIGLGKIWKTAWNRASPQEETILLQ